MIAGFSYKDLQTQDILDSSPLYLANVDGAGSGLATSRSMLEGETTFSRRFANEYGAMYEPLSFTYSMFKIDGSKFTVSEQRKIEAWLTSPKISNKLVFTDCNNNSYTYYGYFSAIEWDTGFHYLNFTFDSKYPYALQEVITTVYDAVDPNINATSFIINVPSDEYEEFVYPVIIARSVETNEPSSFTFTNVTDGNRTLTVETQQSIYVVIDCQFCRMYTTTVINGSGAEVTQLNFGDVGASGIDNFYFPRLLVGDNQINVTGNVKIDIMYFVPVKKVGGWLL